MNILISLVVAVWNVPVPPYRRRVRRTKFRMVAAPLLSIKPDTLAARRRASFRLRHIRARWLVPHLQAEFPSLFLNPTLLRFGVPECFSSANNASISRIAFAQSIRQTTNCLGTT